MTRRGMMWSATALLGIVCAAAVGWSATLLAGQHIGLSSEPLSAAGGLAPPRAVRQLPPGGHEPVRRVSHQDPTRETGAPRVLAPAVVASSPSAVAPAPAPAPAPPAVQAPASPPPASPSPAAPVRSGVSSAGSGASAAPPRQPDNSSGSRQTEDGHTPASPSSGGGGSGARRDD